MKQFLIATILAGGIAFSGFAQQQPKKTNKSAEERAELHTKRMQQELGLTNEQAQKLKTINLAHAKEMQEYRKSTEAERNALKEQRKTLHSKHQEQLKSVLTEEQYQKHQANMEAKHQKRKQHRQHKYKQGDWKKKQ
ncbi:MAG: hypothetical protein LPJ89_09770 [Hymenobacteraceae bacterium]|nr:hypothetical protein [Hymenobacteraceae bacterium]MDX5397682.1 hypothetical protein [Hymenobacteraceae bacterium]MDX5444054.1 hypothetical protein [Hymenobacteraceae bacterium]MDX5513760.1 hypothetical protein [Hymenobacteraceae bacterium]